MYHLFGYSHHRLGGGMNDYRGSFDTIEEAKEAVYTGDYCDVFEIVTQAEGDYVKLARLVVVEKGFVKWEKWTVEWEKRELA